MITFQFFLPASKMDLDEDLPVISMVEKALVGTETLGAFTFFYSIPNF
jgi:hypothetical protein